MHIHTRARVRTHARAHTHTHTHTHTPMMQWKYKYFLFPHLLLFAGRRNEQLYSNHSSGLRRCASSVWDAQPVSQYGLRSLRQAPLFHPRRAGACERLATLPTSWLARWHRPSLPAVDHAAPCHRLHELRQAQRIALACCWWWVPVFVWLHPRTWFP